MAIGDRIKEIIAAELDVDIEEVTEDAFLADNLNADPYDLEALAEVLAEEFEITIDEEEIELWSTVGDLIQTVLDKNEE